MQRKANFLVSVLPLTMRLELKTIVYLDSIFFSLCNVDDEVQSRIRLASFIFGRLLHHNTSSTEIAVYRAVYITPPHPHPCCTTVKLGPCTGPSSKVWRHSALIVSSGSLVSLGRTVFLKSQTFKVQTALVSRLKLPSV